jgi:hypothetical protein
MTLSANRFIVLAFLKLGEDEPFVNQLTALVSKNKFIHVELGFENSMYFSIMHGSKAILRQKKLDNPNYTVRSLKVSQDQYDACYSICNDLNAKNIQFDNTGMFMVLFNKMFCCWSCRSPLDETKYTFCSKIITQVLQEAQVTEVMHLHAESTTPSDLYEAVKDSHNNVVFSTKISRPDFRLLIP